MRMATLRARADYFLNQKGLTKTRAFRALRKEFPQAENVELNTALDREGLTGTYALWAEIGNPLRPVICRRDPRKFS